VRAQCTRNGTGSDHAVGASLTTALTRNDTVVPAVSPVASVFASGVARSAVRIRRLLPSPSPLEAEPGSLLDDFSGAVISRVYERRRPPTSQKTLPSTRETLPSTRETLSWR